MRKRSLDWSVDVLIEAPCIMVLSLVSGTGTGSGCKGQHCNTGTTGNPSPDKNVKDSKMVNGVPPHLSASSQLPQRGTNSLDTGSHTPGPGGHVVVSLSPRFGWVRQAAKIGCLLGLPQSKDAGEMEAEEWTCTSKRLKMRRGDRLCDEDGRESSSRPARLTSCAPMKCRVQIQSLDGRYSSSCEGGHWSRYSHVTTCR